MEIEYFKLGISVIGGIIAYNGFRISQRSFEEAQQAVYLKLYEVVQKHHSKEVTDLRKCAHQLSEKLQQATAAGVSLQKFDSEFHSNISALANYYESLGMFLQYRWEKFPLDSKEMMLAMLHNSVAKIWPLIYQNKDAIYPNNRSRDWAQSFQWLHSQVEIYRRERNLA